MPPSSGELWGHHLMPQEAIVDCLLPTGIVIPLPCARDATLEDIKANLWIAAKRYPLYNLLADPALYIFVSITQDAEREEFFDESRRLCDLRLFQLILKVVEPEGNKVEKILNYEIGKAIGISLHDVDQIEDMEVIQYRRSLFSVCKEVVESRDPNDLYQQALFAYPPEVEATATLPSSLLKKLDNGTLIMCVWQDTQEPKRTTIKIPYDTLPSFAIAEVLSSISRKMGYSKDQRMQLVDGSVDYYVLKVCGVQEYFLKPFPLCQYRYIRQCLRKGEIPELVLHPREELHRSLPDMEFHLPMYMRKLPQQIRSPWISLWTLPGKLKLHVLLATYVSVWDVDTIYVRAGVFHGPESLCQVVDSPQVTYSNPKWDKLLTFDLDLVNLPRTARLCLSICSVAKRRRKEEHCMVAWGNLNLFNYEGYLLSGKISLHLWPVPKGMDELLNRLGTSGPNPVNESPCLELEMESYAMPVLYPDYEQIEKYAPFLKTYETKLMLEEELTAKDVVKEIIQKDRGFADSEHQEDFQWRYRKDPLSDMSEQEKDLLWRFRKQCVLLPHSLPRLLDAVKWEERDQTSQMLILLKSWPPVPPEVALELLDCKYADPSVRKYAVKWLDTSLTDDKLSQYLLQLVQTLKYEPYLDNDLARFLLKRALTNKKIGHFLFWYMKSEMHVPGVSIRFGLMLEAYCRGAGAHLKQLVRQVEALDKLTKLSDTLKDRKLEPLKERLKFLHEQVMQTDYLEALHNWTSPLKNSHILGKLEVKECKILDSAKRPLWLVWNNPDPKAECLVPHHAIIFKNGDDLRQDMLTLQMIRIMDHIWQSEDLDLRLTPYACLSTGKEVGMIEVVRKSKTVYSIQKASKWGAFQMDDTQLHKWIKEKSKGMESKYEQAIENFTLSCAGYCVATFILGIGDRHPDNIMVNEDGQIFHIDFGHFLGHFKKKFGINRERVPFVLTDDFLQVISKGVENPRKSKEFKKFQGLCVEAYLALRHHASLLITLFMMMLPTGIPELQSIDDVGYLRKTLAVEKTEAEAIEYFKNQLCDAYSSAWKTKVDWFFHGVNH